MSQPDPPKTEPKAGAGEAKSADVVKLEQRLIPEKQPENLSGPDAQKIIRILAADTSKIVVIPYGERRARERKVTRRQIEKCVQLGTIQEGPFLNKFGNWQMNLYRHAAGEEVTCVVAIEWATRVLVINTF